MDRQAATLAEKGEEAMKVTVEKGRMSHSGQWRAYSVNRTQEVTNVYLVPVDSPGRVWRAAWRVIGAWYWRVTAPWRRERWEE